MHIESREPAVQVQRCDRLEPSAHATDESTSPYRHDDWFGDNDITDDREPEAFDRSVLHTGTTKEEWVAMTILRRNATVLCPHCLANDDQSIEISDPNEHVPRIIIVESPHGTDIMVELAVLPKSHRACPRCGSVTFGGPLADRTFEAFKHILDEVVASAKIADYPPSKLRQARSDALAQKGRDDGPHDVTIMADFVRDLASNDDSDSDN
ncbi:hypothetical protein C2R22_24470 (plasmid) [Salinigranum rubrum]|uniref:Uncharacterized protein n=1 Tax=Salinigranum rubrum TaxID=755307 RepID=A0A2I8VS25_9EURY|nr:hypothetical protein [Salinigranum rubrum]AUV84686.1 hypothetical protein C2R22_24470 [Salinigranum rubrum]